MARPSEGVRMSSSVRTAVGVFLELPWVQRAVIALIVLNGVIIGLETSHEIMRAIGPWLEWSNHIIVGVFVIEISLRIYAEGWRFFRSGWNVFDFVVVALALIPASSASQVLRVLRILRVLRLLSVVRSMRLVIESLAAAMPGVASIAGLLAIVLYVFSVMSTMLFGELQPDAFGSLGLAFVQHFRLMVGDGWPDVVVPTVAVGGGWVWLYFIAYTVVSMLIVLNLLIGVIVEAVERRGDAIQDEQATDQAALQVEAAAPAEAAPRAADQAALLAELRAIRSELAELRASAAKPNPGAASGERPPQG